MTYAQLLARGCTCGTELCECPLHASGDNRGIAAWFKARMPGGFPMAATCGVCGDGGLLYPNVEIDDPARSGEYRPTLICPTCSLPVSEQRLVADAKQFGHMLNERRVFAAVSA